MTEYSDIVEKRKLELAYEEYVDGVKQIHCFNTDDTRVWYDDREPEGRVIDTMYNDGRIRRQLSDDTVIWIGQKKKKWQIMDDMKRAWADMRRRSGE
tara:strand:- start:321 stop:611 length:291 start_codon:yes stop_codon:yes gene_type:complete